MSDESVREAPKVEEHDADAAKKKKERYVLDGDLRAGCSNYPAVEYDFSPNRLAR